MGCYPGLRRQLVNSSKSSNEGSRGDVVSTNPRPLVVSPPPAPNLTSLLTGHIGREAEQQAAENGTALDGGQVDKNIRSPIKKKSKKAKSTKEDKSTKRDRSGSSLKKSSFMTISPYAPICTGTTPRRTASPSTLTCWRMRKKRQSGLACPSPMLSS
jgi:hypothetical protein